MENEKIIIRHVLRRLRQNEIRRLTIEAETLGRLLDKVPSFCADDVIDALCKEEKDA